MGLCGRSIEAIVFLRGAGGMDPGRSAARSARTPPNGGFAVQPGILQTFSSEPRLFLKKRVGESPESLRAQILGLICLSIFPRFPQTVEAVFLTFLEPRACPEVRQSSFGILQPVERMNSKSAPWSER
jgi:hypothetical protein